MDTEVEASIRQDVSAPLSVVNFQVGTGYIGQSRSDMHSWNQILLLTLRFRVADVIACVIHAFFYLLIPPWEKHV
jgi:hypothetical protein